MAYYVKTYTSREEGMVDKRDSNTVIYQYNSDVIAYDTEPATGYVEDPAFVVEDAKLIPENPTDCKIYRFIQVSNYNKDEAPIDHNYNSGLTTTLFPKREFLHGELFKVSWFADQAFTDLILEVNIVYNRDVMGFPLERTTTRAWYAEDGTVAFPTKITKKEYTSDPILQLTEGVKRRKNLTTNMTATVMGLMVATIAPLEGESELDRQSRIIVLGRDFLALHKIPFNNFTDDSNKDIIDIIKRDQAFWLDNINPLAPPTTIRDYIINELSAVGV